MHSRPRSRWLAAALAAAFALGALAASAVAATPAQIDAAVERGAAWIRDQQNVDGSLPGFNGDWAVTTLAAAGAHPADVATSASAPTLQDWLYGTLASDDYRLATMQPWTVAGTIGKAALLAHSAGIRPTRVAPDVNLAAALATKWDLAAGTFTPAQINSDGFALLAGPLLDLPRGVREKVVSLVRASQHNDGGWTFIAGGNLASPGDVDMTGAALAMLCQEGATPADGQVADGLAFLKTRQDTATGGIVAGPWVPPLNAPSNAWALIGLHACGVDPDSPTWLSADGKSVTDFLVSLQRADGSFRYVPEDGASSPQDMNAAEAAVRALSGAIFSADPPAREQASAPRWRPVDAVADGTAVPIALGVDDRASDVRFCAVTVPSGASLETVLQTAATASLPAGCVSDPQFSGGRVSAINGAGPAAPGSAWVASIAGAGFAPAGGQAVRAGATVALELRRWSLSATAWSLAFDVQPRDTIGAAQSLTLTAAVDDVRPVRVRTLGDAGDDFVVSGDTCSQSTLDEGETCSVRVRFAPSAVGARAATLVVSDAAGDAVTAIDLSGSGGPLLAGAPSAPGPEGPQGAPGAAGPRGSAGPAGARGQRGRRGRAAKVSCRIVRVRGQRRVRCSVRYASGARASASRRARLTRNGRTYVTGRLARLRPIRTLTRGTYSLRVGDTALRVRVR